MRPRLRCVQCVPPCEYSFPLIDSERWKPQTGFVTWQSSFRKEQTTIMTAEDSNAFAEAFEVLRETSEVDAAKRPVRKMGSTKIAKSGAAGQPSRVPAEGKES
jgi:hypothetical protein